MGPDSRLKTLVDRVSDQLSRELDSWELKTREARRRGLDLFSKPIDAPPASPADARSLTRQEKRDLKRREEIESASTAGGAFAMLMALVILTFAVTHVEVWWLIFVALGVGKKGAEQLTWAARRNQALAPPQPLAPPVSSRRHEVDVVCDQLLADLAASPEAVRDFLQNPEQTVESLRTTSRSLDARRKQLAAEKYPAQLAALEAQRAELLARHEATADAIARTRLNGAVESIDGQVSALRQLLATAERVEGEYTSLLVLLQELRTRVAVAKSSTSTVQLGGLRENVERLNDELEAISGALAAPPEAQRLTGS